MQIISISRGSQSLGVEFACALADKLGYECVSREDLLEEATRQRIPIGKLETAMVKPHVHSERLAAELEHYKSLVTSILCEKALDHDIVYHGRTGHLLLPGIDHILRIRVVSDLEQRIASVMEKLSLSRKKAKGYIESVEDDRRRWVREFYGVDWDAYMLYDLVLNLSQVGSSNAATAVCAMAQLPEFQSTPSSTNALKDLSLSAKARLALARNEKTADLNVKVTANRGAVYVTYSYLQAKRIDDVTEVLQNLPDTPRVVCTQAHTAILWIQENFDVAADSVSDVLTLAGTWDAAVEIVKLLPHGGMTRWPVEPHVTKRGLEAWRQTGIMEGYEAMEQQEPADISRLYERLITSGQAGGKRVVDGTLKGLLNAIDRSSEYRLIVLDNIFLSKGPEARTRMTQDWSNTISETLRTPVVTLKELQTKYRFGTKQSIQMLLAALLTAVVVWSVFHFENDIIDQLLLADTVSRVLTTACVAVFVPIFAFLYSSVTSRFLRMIGLD